MFCDKCGTEVADNALYCPNCGHKVQRKKHKNIYIALILTFIITGLGSVYAGNAKKGIILFVARLALGIMGVFLNIFFVLSFIVWAYAFYEAYKDVQIANGNPNPHLLEDYKGWNQNSKIIAVLIIFIIVSFALIGSYNVMSVGTYVPEDDGTHYYVSDSASSRDSGSSYSSSSSHYGGVDDSPSTIAKNDPDWYYDHYEYGDNDEIDNYLESEGYD